MTLHDSVGRTVVVTGASGGIGRACAVAFGARGDRLALIARGRAGLDGAVREVERAGAAKVIAIEADMADPEAVEAAAERVERELGAIDVWVNDAFASVFAPFVEITPEEFRRVTQVSYLGYVYATGAALRRMLPRDAGVIVQVGSAIAYRGIPLQSAYSGAKHAVQGWNEALRCELLASGTGVRTTMVQMPAVNTPQFDWVRSRLPRRAQPVPPIYQPEVAARAVLYAADHPRRREYWVGGSTVATLLANAVVPGLLDRYLARTGFASQQTDELRPRSDPDNLFRPVDSSRDFGAHGRFDDSARARSLQQRAAHRLGALAGGARRATGRVRARLPRARAGLVSRMRAARVLQPHE
ncbi:SDR family oxidoreductase [Kitasatospora purpeofusca]|uniref:SDR family oxidoreductase n=1 Tax=Kitasatospora purpeofusca TaxID=67352 RepID=UPI002A59F8B1|nr:SDR family oxidoreductase [Kitasatospora purpeofusca]MDY0811367.1 SDR family oxidoreductase [Kitasatospora purpeofusca]